GGADLAVPGATGHLAAPFPGIPDAELHGKGPVPRADDRDRDERRQFHPRLHDDRHHRGPDRLSADPPFFRHPAAPPAAAAAAPPASQEAANPSGPRSRKTRELTLPPPYGAPSRMPTPTFGKT